jgi:putative transposase
MVSPSSRRRAVKHGCTRWKLSERRSCWLVGLARSTHRYEARTKPGDADLLKRIHEIAAKHPRYGCRRVATLIRRSGWLVNRKRVHRLWKLEGLRVPTRQRKKRRLGHGDNGIVRRKAERPNHVWSYDFVWDQTEDGRMLKILPVVDEFSRRCLTIEVARSITAVDVVRVLERLFEEHGEPEFIRSDNGPEFIADAVQGWLKKREARTLYITPGSPWENAYSESFNSRLRDELLDRELFTSEAEARVLLEDHRQEYNEERPHSGIGEKTPAEFMEAWRASNHADPPKSDAQRSPRIDNLGLGRVSSTPELAGAGLS